MRFFSSVVATVAVIFVSSVVFFSLQGCGEPQKSEEVGEETGDGGERSKIDSETQEKKSTKDTAQKADTKNPGQGSKCEEDANCKTADGKDIGLRCFDKMCLQAEQHCRGRDATELQKNRECFYATSVYRVCAKNSFSPIGFSCQAATCKDKQPDGSTKANFEAQKTECPGSGKKCSTGQVYSCTLSCSSGGQVECDQNCECRSSFYHPP